MAAAASPERELPVGSQTEGSEESSLKKRRFGLFRRRSKASVKDESFEEKPVKSKKSKGSESMILCPVCYTFRPKELFPDISTCEHRSCIECLKQYITLEINESRVILTCPECAERFHPNDIKLILNDDQLMAKYDQFTLRRALVSDPDCRWCPAPDCSYAVIANGCASCPKLVCERPNCRTEFCYHCKQVWHPNQTCDAARQRRNLGSLSLSDGRSSHSSDDMKTCPRCAALIIKMDDGSCNHMTCAVCGAEFCWLCMKEISDLHYLSPSGCTFWGKKPWSRKKKILWQMGTLIGAPLGIALAAGVVLPAMVIGIPVYVGRQIHDKYQKPFHSSRQRNLAITGGVTLSVIVSPILAALTVGVGVPIALGYIYGVVPVSLCRGGGCATVTTLRSGRGVNLEFDDNDSVSASHLAQFTTPYNSRRNSPRTSERVSGGGMVTVVATVNSNNADSVSQTSKQPSISMSQDCSSLDSSNIGGRIGDNDSHASLIPAPRSCTVSIASSFDNFNIGTVDGIACSSSINEGAPSESEAKCISEEVEIVSDEEDEDDEDDDNLSVVEKVSTTGDIETDIP